MTGNHNEPWFTRFLVECDERSDSEIVWSDSIGISVPVRKATLAEKFSILLVGAFAIGWIVVMVVTLVVAVYISRH
jgi:hypothetical protein